MSHIVEKAEKAKKVFRLLGQGFPQLENKSVDSSQLEFGSRKTFKVVCVCRQNARATFLKAAIQYILSPRLLRTA